MQNSNDKRSVTSGSRAVDLGTQIQHMLDTLCIPASHREVEEALFIWILCLYVLPSHRLSETTKVLFRQQSEDTVIVILVTCEMKARGVI